MTIPIQASELRLGMFVHLNVGWMSHPFPLSSFKIASQDQIETIRSLGLARLTWSPDRSDLPPEAAGRRLNRRVSFKIFFQEGSRAESYYQASNRR